MTKVTDDARLSERKTTPVQIKNHVPEVRSLLQILVPVIFGAFALAYLYQLVLIGGMGMLDPLMVAHAAAFLGVPLAAIASMCVVLLLRSTSGPIEFEAWGLKFKGASGPIIMWTIVFITLASAIKLLW
jgi:hypothetical protein